MIALKAWAQQVSATVKMRPKSRSKQVGVKGVWCIQRKLDEAQTHTCTTNKYCQWAVNQLKKIN